MSTTSSTDATRRPVRWANRLGSLVLNTVLVLATLAGLAYLAPSLLGYERYVITGGSMSGTFEKGSIAFEKPVPVEDLRVGDVITYQPPADSGVSTLVTHRIVSAEMLDTGALQFRTQGDANASPDPWQFELTQAEQPVVKATLPWVGYVFVALADRDVRMMAIGIPAALIALLSLVELAAAVRERSATRRRRGAAAARKPVSHRSQDVAVLWSSRSQAVELSSVA